MSSWQACGRHSFCAHVTASIKPRTTISATRSASPMTGARVPPDRSASANRCLFRGLSSQTSPARCLLEAARLRCVVDVRPRRPDRSVRLRARTPSPRSGRDGVFVSRLCPAHPCFGLRIWRRVFDHGYFWLRPPASDAVAVLMTGSNGSSFELGSAPSARLKEGMSEIDRHALKRFHGLRRAYRVQGSS
jgi:hypothetical protein